MSQVHVQMIFSIPNKLHVSWGTNLAPQTEVYSYKHWELTGRSNFIMNKFTAKHSLEEPATPITFLAGERGKKINR